MEVGVIPDKGAYEYRRWICGSGDDGVYFIHVVLGDQMGVVREARNLILLWIFLFLVGCYFVKHESSYSFCTEWARDDYFILHYVGAGVTVACQEKLRERP